MKNSSDMPKCGKQNCPACIAFGHAFIVQRGAESAHNGHLERHTGRHSGIEVSFNGFGEVGNGPAMPGIGSRIERGGDDQ